MQIAKDNYFISLFKSLPIDNNYMGSMYTSVLINY